MLRARRIHRTIALRGDPLEIVLEVLAHRVQPAHQLPTLRERSHPTFDKFRYSIAGSHLMNRKVPIGLDLPGTAPEALRALFDEPGNYLEGDSKWPALARGPICRTTPDATN